MVGNDCARKQFVIACAILTLVGSFLPWVILSGEQRIIGVYGPGLLALLAAILVIRMTAFGEWERLERAGVLSMGAVVLLVIAYMFRTMDGGANGQTLVQSTEPAFGLYLSLIGGLGLVIGGGLGLVIGGGLGLVIGATESAATRE